MFWKLAVTSLESKSLLMNKYSFLQPKSIILIIAALFSVLMTSLMVIFDIGTPQHNLFRIIDVLGLGILIFAWTYYDSIERNQLISPRLRILLVIFGTIALIYYLFKSRGLKNGLISIGKLALFWIGLIILNLIFEGLTLMAIGKETL